MTIVLTGGGSGGHIFPLVSVSREIKKNQNDTQIFYIGPKDSFAQDAFRDENIYIKTIFSGKIRRYFSIGSILQNIIDICFKIPFGFIQSIIYLNKIKPAIVFSKGGYGSMPVIFASKLLRIPVFLHESDSIAGLANKITGQFAKKIFVAFPVEKVKNLPKNKLIRTGNPIRSKILDGQKEKAQQIFNLALEKPILLVLGGSQGSKRINSIILENLDCLLEKFEIIHQTGTMDYKRVLACQKREYHVYNFLNEEMMGHALACADCVISRSGSNSISEVSIAQKPSILVPLPESAQGHQSYNAEIYENTGACIKLEEKDITKDLFQTSLEKIMSDKASFCVAAKDFEKGLAAEIIANTIFKEIND